MAGGIQLPAGLPEHAAQGVNNQTPFKFPRWELATRLQPCSKLLALKHSGTHPGYLLNPPQESLEHRPAPCARPRPIQAAPPRPSSGYLFQGSPRAFTLPTALSQAPGRALPWSASVQRWTLYGSASGAPPAPLHCRTNPLPVLQQWGKPRWPQRPRRPEGGAGCRPRPSSLIPAGTQQRPEGLWSAAGLCPSV